MLDDLKADVTAALAGTLRPATIWEYGEFDDGMGNVSVGYANPLPCEGIRGSFESVLAGLSGIPRTDAKIEILASSLDREPLRLDIIQIEGGWWIVKEIEVDPAGAVWLCQCSATTPVGP